MRDLFRYRSFIQNLVLKDVRLKYRHSVLGIVWSLLHPLLMVVVLTVGFKHVMRVQMENYAYFLLAGLLPWNFFSGAVLASTGSIIGGASLIKKVYFPREILPIATVLFHFVQLLLALAVFVPTLVLVAGVPLHGTSLLVFPLLLVHLLFTIGVALILSPLTAFFRDVAHLTEVGVMLLFWLTPILYPAATAPPGLQRFFEVSPLAAFALAYQDVLFWGRVPSVVLGSTVLLWTASVLLIGHTIFRWYSPTLAEEV